MDAAAQIANRERLSLENRVVLILSAILHDIGKSAVTAIQLPNGQTIPYNEYNEKIHGPGDITSYGHQDALIEDINIILDQLEISDDMKNKIRTLT